MKISRRRFLVALGAAPVAAGLSGGYMRWVEPSWIEITEKSVRIGRFNQPVRILHLSDFHASEVVSLPFIEKAIDQSLQLDADVAFLTGDFITWQLEDEAEYGRILGKLASRMPTFACVGNHDGGRWAGSSRGYDDFSRVRRLLENSGARFLFNEAARVSLNGESMTVAGLGDYWSGDTKPERALAAKRAREEAVFVLNHNPDAKAELLPYDWDLMCCGHTHGGQLVVPLLGYRPFLPVRDKTFPEGLRSWGERHIHITRGVGNLHGLRFNCRPEISMLEVV